jgi:NADPH:quinone reductase
MRAVICRAYGPPANLTVEETPTPTPGTHEVLVRVEAAGVNFADVLMVAGQYQVKPPVPFIAGSEFAGEVIEVGSAVAGIAKGERVMGSPAQGGAFAEYIAIEPKRIWKIPPGLSFDVAAGLVIGHGTAYFGLQERTSITPGEWVLVTGAAGGVGIAAVEIAKRLGARVIAAVGSDRKVDVARAHGADAVVNYSSEDLRARVKDITAARGYDVLFDTVGGDIFDTALRAAAPGARLLIVGFAAGRIPTIPANYLLIKNISAVGVGFGAMVAAEPRVVQRVVDALAALHNRQPFTFEIGGAVALDAVPQALEQLSGRRAVGKLVIKPHAAS